ncbi:MAG: hypothetical protein CMJ40_03885 [Phycisphaerae bacterium]|nr:hypothetical protein [Phycisphaerae bacterium]|tara:strand:- start:277 stop:1152 length:876 start_codon:yes stop_codon:yes gene_type:complete
MRKFGIIISIIAGVLLLLIIALYLSVDAIARYAIRTEGSSLMGVETSVESVDLGIFRNSTTITGLSIANPKGFKRDYLLQVEDFYIESNLSKFLSSDIDIPLVRLSEMNFDLEQIDDRLNVTEVVDHVAKDVSSQDDTDNSGSVKLNIRRLEIDDITLTAEGKIVNIAGGSLTAQIPKIALADIGTESDSDQIIGQLVGVMMKILVQHIAANPIKGLSGFAISQISASVEAIPGLKQIGLGKPISEAIQGIGSGASKAIGGIGNAIDGIGNAITGNRGGKDDKKKEDKGSP